MNEIFLFVFYRSPGEVHPWSLRRLCHIVLLTACRATLKIELLLIYYIYWEIDVVGK